MSRCWIAVASAAHVRRGKAAGFMQVCHGKAAPLRRVLPGDRVVYYSPATEMGGQDRLQSFTAIGIVRQGDAYQVDMGGGFCPFRRNVDWLPSTEVPIAPLLDRLSFTAGKRNWGYQLRFGLFAISEDDWQLIATEMMMEQPQATG